MASSVVPRRPELPSVERSVEGFRYLAGLGAWKEADDLCSEVLAINARKKLSEGELIQWVHGQVIALVQLGKYEAAAQALELLRPVGAVDPSAWATSAIPFSLQLLAAELPPRVDGEKSSEKNRSRDFTFALEELCRLRARLLQPSGSSTAADDNGESSSILLSLKAKRLAAIDVRIAALLSSAGQLHGAVTAIESAVKAYSDASEDVPPSLHHRKAALYLAAGDYSTARSVIATLDESVGTSLLGAVASLLEVHGMQCSTAPISPEDLLEGKQTAVAKLEAIVRSAASTEDVADAPVSPRSKRNRRLYHLALEEVFGGNVDGHALAAAECALALCPVILDGDLPASLIAFERLIELHPGRSIGEAVVTSLNTLYPALAPEAVVSKSTTLLQTAEVWRPGEFRRRNE